MKGCLLIHLTYDKQSYLVTENFPTNSGFFPNMMAYANGRFPFQIIGRLKVFATMDVAAAASLPNSDT
jgi:hypothetical protein